MLFRQLGLELEPLLSQFYLQHVDILVATPQHEMSNSKGKNPANGNEDAELDSPGTQAEPSLFSRVADSASGLTRSAFTTPSGHELNGHAAAALSNAGKGQTSGRSPGESSWAEGSKLVQSSGHAQASGSSSLRAGQSEAHVRQSEADFSDFLDGIDSFKASENDAHLLSTETPDRFEEVWTRSQVGLRLSNGIPAAATTTVAEQERRDGEDVLNLLSGPTSLDEFEAPEEENEFYDWGLSQDQIIELRAMTKEMFPPTEQHNGITADNPLNLVPLSGDYDQQQWFQEWDGVLNRYADEVWGGLLPLVKEARQDVEDIRNGEATSEQPKALRRLNAILNHLQKR